MFHLRFILFEDKQGENNPTAVLNLKISDKDRALSALYQAFEAAATCELGVDQSEDNNDEQQV